MQTLLLVLKAWATHYNCLHSVCTVLGIVSNPHVAPWEDRRGLSADILPFGKRPSTESYNLEGTNSGRTWRLTLLQNHSFHSWGFNPKPAAIEFKNWKSGERTQAESSGSSRFSTMRAPVSRHAHFFLSLPFIRFTSNMGYFIRFQELCFEVTEKNRRKFFISVQCLNGNTCM